MLSEKVFRRFERDCLKAVFAQQPRLGLQHRPVVIDEEDRWLAGTLQSW